MTSKEAALAGFFELHQPTIEEGFRVTNTDIAAAESLDAAVEITQPWVQGDHSRPVYEFDLTDDADAVLDEVYETLDMVQERPLLRGHHQHTLVLGAIHRGNNNRLQYVNRALQQGRITTDHLWLLGGERPIYPEVETEEIDQNVRELEARGVKESWFRKVQSGEEKLEWETDLLRLAAAVHLGPMTLANVARRDDVNNSLKAYHFDWSGLPVTLTHSLAVPRKNAAPRHTTESCIMDWVRDYPPAESASVAFIGAQPHLDRMALSALRMFRKVGRDDLQVEIGGSAKPAVKHSIPLGEIARRLWEEQQLV